MKRPREPRWREVALECGIAVAILALGDTVAIAGSATSTLAVTATVRSSCSASTVPVAFGTYTPGAGPVTGSATITVMCTSGLGFAVALDGGSTSGGSISQRLMSSGARPLEYNLYTSSALNSIWGDGVTGATRSGVASSDAPATRFTVFGLVPDSAVNQLATVGVYSDVVTVTITY